VVPVVVVGAGPIGLSMAIGLRFFGVGCVVVERHDSTLDFPKGRAVQARSMEIFRQWGIEERLRRVGLPATEVTSAFLGETLLSESFQRISFVEPGSTAVSPCERLICSQELLEAELRLIADEVGADVRFGHELLTFEQDDGGVRATIRDRTAGREYVVDALFLVAADGGRGGCRDALGIPLLGPGPVGNSVSIYVDAPLRDRIEDRVSVLYGVSRPRPGAGFAVVDNDRRWLLMLPRDPAAEPDDMFTPDHCVALVRAAIGDDSVPVTYRGHRLWQPAASWAPTMSAGRVFLAGDAAHVTTPAGGLGMNVGVADVHNLAWKLAAVLEGSARRGLLSTYGNERVPAGQFTAEASMAIGAQQRDPNARRGALGVAFGAWYQSDAVVPDGSRPPDVADPIHDYVPSGCPGVRAPHAMTPDGISVLDRFGRRPCVLLEDAHPARGVVRRDGPQPFEVVTLSGTEWREVYGVDVDGIVVVRPDGHIAFRRSSCPNPDEVLGPAVNDSFVSRGGGRG
jgi:2-polyprenyl-6-methoxyphenol hydroxylase-like FAD-dependent oxidoreductase